MKTAAIAIAALALACGTAHAQITTINPNGMGGYNVFTPGQPITNIQPNGLGGYNVFTPPRFAPPPIQYAPALPAPPMRFNPYAMPQPLPPIRVPGEE